jgi:CHAT domain-containing protein/tetratricopeptide (TPR) repeat protein
MAGWRAGGRGTGAPGPLGLCYNFSGDLAGLAMRRWIEHAAAWRHRRFLLPCLPSLMVLAAAQLPAVSPRAPVPLSATRAAGAGGEPEIAGERRLKLPPGTLVRLAITPSPVEMVVQEIGPDGVVPETLVVPGGGGRPLQLSWIILRGGEYRFTAAPHAAAISAGRVAMALVEERPAVRCDVARLRAERALLRARVTLAKPGEEPAGRASTLLAGAAALSAEVGERELSLAVMLQEARAAGRRPGQSAAATEIYAGAARLARRLGDRRAEVEALAGRASLHAGMGKVPQAKRLAALAAVLRWRRRLGDETGIAEAELNLGSFLADLHQDNNESPAAEIRNFRRALALQWRNGDLASAALSLGEIGGRESDALRARAHLDMSLELGQLAGDLAAQDLALSNSAYLHLRLNELAESARDFAAERKLLADHGEPDGWALAGVALAALYLGDNDRAWRSYTDACTSFSAQGDARGRVTALLGIGHALSAQGRNSEAVSYFQQGLGVAVANGVTDYEDVAHYSLGKAFASLGRLPAAIVQFRAVLKRETDPSWRAQTLVELGKALDETGRSAAAEASFQQAIRLGGRVPLPPLVMASAQYGVARLQRHRGHLAAACAAIDRALALTEKLRASLFHPDQRVSFVASRRAYYELNVDLLVRRRHDAEALAASEQARARGLLDLLDERGIDLRHEVSGDLKRRRTAIAQRLERLQARLLASDRLHLSPGAARRLDDELSRANDEEKDLEAQIHSRNSGDAAIHTPPPRLGEIQALLDDRSALLEFLVGTDSSALFVVTREGLFTVSGLPPRRVIADLVGSVRSGTARQGRLGAAELAESSYQLYRELLLPAISRLHGKDQWLVAADGPLHLLNFEQLLTAPPPPRAAPRELPYLIRERSITYVPSAAVLAQLLRQVRPTGALLRSAGKQLVAFADPVLHRRATPMKALPGARQEVEQIAALFPAERVAVFAGGEATKEKVEISPVVASAQIVHFAVHGFVDEKQPETFGLILGGGPSGSDLLSVREIFNLQLSARLVVLSACQSGWGKEAFGEGLTGMTRAFLYAGAGSVVVSLWAVEDESTAELMTSFYRHLQQGKAVAEALRSAKLEMIDGSSHSRPFYWAPFLLIGRPS